MGAERQDTGTPGPKSRRSRGLRGLRVARWSVALAPLSLVVAGCSLRDDPGYNRYAPNNGDPTLLQRADRLVDSAEDALDNGQQRLENVLD